MSGGAAAAASRERGAVHPIRTDLVLLARLAGPVVAARLGIMTMGLTDSIVVGRHSAEQLGYLALGWAASASVLGSALGLLSGVQVMASRALGEGDAAAAGAALRRGLVYGLWVGLAAAVVLSLGGPALLGVLGLKGGLAAGASRPLVILAISMPSFALSTAASSWLEGLGRTTAPMMLMWAANVLNLGLDLVLVPGGFGLPAMGAAGAASATLIGRTILALATLGYIALMPDARALGVFRRPPPGRAAAIEQRRIGYGAAASNFFEMTAFSSMNVFAGWIGPLAVAAWAVALNVIALVFMAPLGLSTATAVLVARAHGASDAKGLCRAAAVGFAVTAAFGIAVGLVVWPSARLIAPLFTTDARTIAMAGGALALACLFFPPDGLQVVVAQALRARGDVVAPTLTHLTSYVVVMVPLAYVLAIRAGFGLTGIVWAVIIASYISAGLLAGRFWMLARRG
ncbi:MAG TPA: MATE family efflux transporter [Caulobacteraceae bacterium]|nr:MATE family efflux transporter [Caulobacteraceae bacterium]